MFIVHLLLFLITSYWWVRIVELTKTLATVFNLNLINLTIRISRLYFKYRHYRRYTRFGLKGPAPWPILGNVLDIGKLPFSEYELNNRQKYGDTYVDYILSTSGCISTSDPEIAKRILVKDFNSFQYRMTPRYMPKYTTRLVDLKSELNTYPELGSRFLNRILIFMQDDWKRIRAQMTPIFTSGKLKQMYKNFEYPIDNCACNIQQLIDAKKAHNVEVKKLMRSFSLDIIANVGDI